MASRGVRKIDEGVMGIGRTIITVDEESFNSVDPGTIYVNAKNGKYKVKLEGKEQWSNPPERGVYVGTAPPANPEEGDLWLDTNMNIDIDESDLDFSGTFIPGTGKGSVDEDQVKKIVNDIMTNNVTIVEELNSVVQLTSETNIIEFAGTGNIKKFNPNSDILMVNQGITTLVKDVNYKINTDNRSIINLNGKWNATKEKPIIFNFRILRNKTVDSSLIEQIKHAGSSKIMIAQRPQGSLELKEKVNKIKFVGLGNIKKFNQADGDSLRVYMNTTALTKNVHYKISEDNESIVKLDSEWDGSKKPILFDFDVINNEVKKSDDTEHDDEEIKKIKVQIEKLANKKITAAEINAATPKDIKMNIEESEKNMKVYINTVTNTINTRINQSEINIRSYIDKKTKESEANVKKYIDEKMNTLKKELENKNNIIVDSKNKQEYKFIVENGKPSLEVIK